MAEILLFFIALTACSPPKEAKIPVQELMNSVREKVAKDNSKTEEQMEFRTIDITKEEGKDIIEAMKLDKNLIEEGTYLSDSTGAKASRVIVIKAKKETDIKTIVAALKAMKEDQETEWKTKDSKEYEKVKNGTVMTNGKYVIYIVYDKMRDIVNVIQNEISKDKESQ